MLFCRVTQRSLNICCQIWPLTQGICSSLFGKPFFFFVILESKSLLLYQLCFIDAICFIDLSKFQSLWCFLEYQLYGIYGSSCPCQVDAQIKNLGDFFLFRRIKELLVSTSYCIFKNLLSEGFVRTIRLLSFSFCDVGFDQLTCLMFHVFDQRSLLC